MPICTPFHTKSTKQHPRSEAEIPQRVKVPDYAHLLPEPIRRFTQPVVMISPAEISSDIHVVRRNSSAAGAAVAAHLVDWGHRDIGFAAGPEQSIDSRERLKGLNDELARRGIRLLPENTYTVGSYTSEAGSEFARRLFESQPLQNITALVLANDALAFDFMRLALQRGIKMPQELSVVGFDGLPHGALLYPALTTMSQPMGEMGRVACGRLFEPLQEPESIEITEFPMVLLKRESTGPAPMRRGTVSTHSLCSSDPP